MWQTLIMNHMRLPHRFSTKHRSLGNNMSNIQSMPISQLNSYRDFLKGELFSEFNHSIDGETFADLIDLHDWCRERLIAVDEELKSRRAVE